MVGVFRRLLILIFKKALGSAGTTTRRGADMHPALHHQMVQTYIDDMQRDVIARAPIAEARRARTSERTDGQLRLTRRTSLVRRLALRLSV